MPLPTPSNPDGSLRINMPRIEDKKIQLLLVMLAKKMAQSKQPGTPTKRIA
jgi:hypothetical protein